MHTVAGPRGCGWALLVHTAPSPLPRHLLFSPPGNPDFVLDCIDDADTKADLIAYCVQNNIKLISSMSAGAKVLASWLLDGNSPPPCCYYTLTSALNVVGAY